MSAKSAITTPKSAEPANISELLKQYASGPIQFAGTDNALYERHLTFDTVVDLKNAGPRERFEAFAHSVRDILSQRWVHTENTYRQQNPKRVYYLSMEFLIGRSLANNVTNLRLDPLAQQAVAQKNLNWLELTFRTSPRRTSRSAGPYSGLGPRNRGPCIPRPHGRAIAAGPSALVNGTELLCL